MIWVDAHLSPGIARWIASTLGHPAKSIRELGLQHAKDSAIFLAARTAGAIVMTKDADFGEMVERLGPPPHVVWLTCGNTSDAELRVLLVESLPRALRLIAGGEPLVEIAG
jgi:predicted nuclease of predicted toxin-antitoxin system